MGLVRATMSRLNEKLRCRLIWTSWCGDCCRGWDSCGCGNSWRLASYCYSESCMKRIMLRLFSAVSSRKVLCSSHRMNLIMDTLEALELATAHPINDLMESHFSGSHIGQDRAAAMPIRWFQYFAAILHNQIRWWLASSVVDISYSYANDFVIEIHSYQDLQTLPSKLMTSA